MKPFGLGDYLHFLNAALLFVGLLVVFLIKDKFQIRSLFSSNPNHAQLGSNSEVQRHSASSVIKEQRKGSIEGGRPFWVWVRPFKEVSIERQYGIRRMKDIWSMKRISSLRRSLICFYVAGALSVLFSISLERSLQEENAELDNNYCEWTGKICLTWRVQAMAYSVAAVSLCTFLGLLFLEDDELSFFRHCFVLIFVAQSVVSQWTTSRMIDATVNSSYALVGLAICLVAAFAIWRESRRRTREGLPRPYRRRIWYILALATADIAWGMLPFLTYFLEPLVVLFPLLLLVVSTGRILYFGFVVGRHGNDIAPEFPHVDLLPRTSSSASTSLSASTAVGSHSGSTGLLETHIHIRQNDVNKQTGEKAGQTPAAELPKLDSFTGDLDNPSPLSTIAA